MGLYTSNGGFKQQQQQKSNFQMACKAMQQNATSYALLALYISFKYQIKY